MKVAIVVNEMQELCHFDNCTYCAIFTVNGRFITEKETVENQGHETGIFPLFLVDKGVNVVISSGMGINNYQFFRNFMIQIITGARGNIGKVIMDYLGYPKEKVHIVNYYYCLHD